MRFREKAGFFLILIGGLTVAMTAQLQTASGQTTIASGDWSGTATLDLGSQQLTAGMTFVVDDEDNVTDGSIQLVFAIPNMSEEMLTVMQESGCLVLFDAITENSEPVSGEFEATSAAGTFAIDSCALEGFDDLEFVNTLSGIWEATLSEGDGVNAEATEEAPSMVEGETTQEVVSGHPNDALSGRELFVLHCSECHDRRGTGTSEAPTLHIALNPNNIVQNSRIGPETMVPFTMNDLPDYQLDRVVDFVLKFDPDSVPRTAPSDSVAMGLISDGEAAAFENKYGVPYRALTP